MRIPRACRPALSIIAVLLAGVSSASAQHAWPGGHPGFHPAANAYSVMMGQEFVDPTALGYQDYGDTCCGPEWYDFRIEATYMKRDDAGRNIDISSDGIAGVGPANIVLSTSDLDFDYDAGLRASARYQIGAVYNIEADFLGVTDWDSQAIATSNNNSLYSAFSQFGNVPFGGFEDVDQATLHQITYRSDFDSVELNVRRSWGDSYRKVSGSWLMGVRYVRLHEQFGFFARVDPHVDPINNVPRNAAQTTYNILTDNDMVGFQLGGQLAACLFPGLVVSGEVKGGVYGNKAAQDSLMSSTTLNPLAESAEDDDVAFLGEAIATVTYQIHPLVKIRAGYEAVFVDGVALATENFNSQPPFLIGSPRMVSINDNGNVFFHGGLLGLEVGW